MAASRTGSPRASLRRPNRTLTTLLAVLTVVGPVSLIGPPSLAAPPTNDNFVDAQILTGTAGTTTGLTHEATRESGEPDHDGKRGQRSIWYRWTATAEAIAIFDTEGSDYDTVLAVYTGDTVGSLTELASDDDSASGLTSEVRFRSAPGETYAIAVDGYSGDAGSVVLNWEQTEPPPNDDFANGQTIVGDRGTTSASNRAATAEPGEPAHAGEQAQHSLWYRWTAPVTDFITFDTEGSEFDTVLAAYEGDDLSDLVEGASDDDSGEGTASHIRFLVTAGTTYHLALDGYRGETGRAVLNWGGGPKFTVTTADDTDDGVCGGVLTFHCSLREAINATNTQPGRNLIVFDIPGSGPYTIVPTSPLPTITDPLEIDGTTQRDDNVRDDDPPLDVQLNGALAGQHADGLRVATQNAVVRGLVINRFGGAGIEITGGGDNLIDGNFIGTDVTGSLALPNGLGVRVLDSPNNRIGDPFTSWYIPHKCQGNLQSGSCEVKVGSNVISGNRAAGLSIEGASSGTRVVSNLIGTDLADATAIPNGSGIEIFSDGNTVSQNHVSGNDGVGIAIHGDNNEVTLNVIGASLKKLQPLSNGGPGVRITGGSGNIIGTFDGSFLGQDLGNLIAANRGDGVALVGEGTTANLIRTNVIGGSPVVWQALCRTVKCPEQQPVYDFGNSGDGIGIRSGASDNVIGGDSWREQNLIAFNHGDGIAISGGWGNRVVSSHIFSNDGLGIDLGPDGVTRNDAGDADVGANGLQNFPVITAAMTGPPIEGRTSTQIKGRLAARQNTTYTIRFFSTAACDPSGYGEGETLDRIYSVPWGSTEIVTDQNGDARFDETISVPRFATWGPATGVPKGHFITATATDPAGNTSEFSECEQESDAAADLEVTLADSPDPVLAGGSLVYTATVTNAGPTDATGVLLTDLLPAGARFVSARTDDGVCAEDAGLVECRFEEIASGGSVVAEIKVEPSNEGVLVNEVAVAGDQIDLTPDNDMAAQSTTVSPAADLRVAQAASPDQTARLGQQITYTVSVVNDGPSGATGVTLTDDLPRAAFVSVASTQGTCARDKAQVVCAVGDMASGAIATVTIVVRANAKGDITNTASVEATFPADPDSANNRSSLTIKVLG